MKKQRFLVRGAIMRKLIVLLVTVAFCVGVFSSPALALKNDALKQWPHMANGGDSPDGDDGGWDVPVESPPPNPFPWFGNLLSWFQSHRLVILIDFVVDDLDTQDTNTDGPTDKDETRRDQGPNPL